jgi:hypothetical protein
MDELDSGQRLFSEMFQALCKQRVCAGWSAAARLVERRDGTMANRAGSLGPAMADLSRSGPALLGAQLDVGKSE